MLASVFRTGLEVVGGVVGSLRGPWYLYAGTKRTTSSMRAQIPIQNREIFILASIYYNNQEECEGPQPRWWHTYTTLTHPYRSRIISDKTNLSCHQKKPSWVTRKFPFDQYDQHPASVPKRKQKKKREKKISLAYRKIDYTPAFYYYDQNGVFHHGTRNTDGYVRVSDKFSPS